MNNLRENNVEMLAYEAPQVEIIEVAVEKGFANSIDGLEEEKL